MQNLVNLNGKNLYSTAFIIWLLFFQNCASEEDPYALKAEYDLCNPQTPVSDPPRIYMSKPGDSTEVFIHWPKTEPEEQSKYCLMSFKTCPSCRIRVEAVSPHFNYPDCRWKEIAENFKHTQGCAPGCLYLQIYDISYPEQTVRAITKSSDLSDGYHSESKQMHIVACGNYYSREVSMRVKLVIEEKLQIIYGSSLETVPSQTFTSPYFPSPYAINSEIYKYKFVSSSHKDFMAISFEDWMLSPDSELKFEGANVLGTISGTSKRPYIISDVSSMNMTFNTCCHRHPGYNFLGFKAVVKFYNSRNVIPNIETKCGDVIENAYGGVIRLLPGDADGLYRDCLWVLKIPFDYSGIFLKVIKYRKGHYSTWRGELTMLEIRNGLTSEGALLHSYSPSRSYDLEYESILSSSGFYVRLKGRYFEPETLVVAYAAYMYDCVDRHQYFKCSNGRCIELSLACDNVNHCGDNSDENNSFCGTTPVTGHSSASGSISVGVIIPMVVAIFLVIVMSLLIIFIRRCRQLNNQTMARTAAPPTQTPRGRRQRHRNRNVQMSVTVSSAEQPPSYEEVIQSTPIGYLNMAFTWCQTEPPSYEEATTPQNSQADSRDTTFSTVDPVSNSTNLGDSLDISSEHQNSADPQPSLMSSLDPGAYVSSSSSSEDASDHNGHDVSSSSDTSTDNDDVFIPNNFNIDFQDGLNQDRNKDGNALDEGRGSQRDQLGVVFPTTGKYKNNNNSVENAVENPVLFGQDLKNPSDSSPKKGQRWREAVRKLSQRRYQRGLDLRQQSERNPGTCSRHRTEAIDGFSSRNEHKNLDPVLDPCSYTGTTGDHSTGPKEEMSRDRISESHRSQSCANLFGGAAGGQLSQLNVMDLLNGDKRFSYAGAGDVSLKRGNLDLHNQINLHRDPPVENLNRFLQDSCHTARRHDEQLSPVARLGIGSNKTCSPGVTQSRQSPMKISQTLDREKPNVRIHQDLGSGEQILPLPSRNEHVQHMPIDQSAVRSPRQEEKKPPRKNGTNLATSDDLVSAQRHHQRMQFSPKTLDSGQRLKYQAEQDAKQRSSLPVEYSKHSQPKQREWQVEKKEQSSEHSPTKISPVPRLSNEEIKAKLDHMAARDIQQAHVYPPPIPKRPMQAEIQHSVISSMGHHATPLQPSFHPQAPRAVGSMGSSRISHRHSNRSDTAGNHDLNVEWPTVSEPPKLDTVIASILPTITGEAQGSTSIAHAQPEVSVSAGNSSLENSVPDAQSNRSSQSQNVLIWATEDDVFV